MIKHATVTVTLNVPPGDFCYYPADDEDGKFYCCGWILKHTGSGKKWCMIFEDADVTDGRKCAACLTAVKKKKW